MTAPAITIRAFEPGDRDACHAVRMAAYVPVYKSFRNLVGEEIAPVAFTGAEDEQGAYFDRICAPEAPDEVFVAVKGGTVVGFVALTANETTKLGELGINAVHPDHANQGIGTAMYAFVLERLKAKGMKAVEVGTGLDDSHAPARRAYEKAGFDRAIPAVHYYRTL